MLFQKMTVGFLVICCLAACDEQQIIKKEMIQIQKKTEVQDTSSSNLPSYNAPKYLGKYLYSYWVAEGSFLVILRDEISTFTMQRITKDYIGPIRHFEIIEPTDNKITGVLYSVEKQNRTSLFTLELSEDKTELTITLPNEKPVTFKETEMTPEEYNASYTWK
ncbi:hypothetical protein [Peribacillus butanolivorans]|uniref:hypothetical protein n=1 Tax=Peribacillus butanolivorans TaxID=421767 RepID=UPI003809CCF2